MGPARKIGWIAGGVAVTVGVALFGLPMLFPAYLKALPADARQFVWPGSPLLAPLFAAPLMALALWAKRLPVWGALGLVLGITVIHVAAVSATMGIYLHTMPTPPVLAPIEESTTVRAAHLAQDRRTAERAGLAAGAVGGALGGAASLLLTGFALRGRRVALTTLAGSALLAGIGALGVGSLTGALVSVATPTLTALWQAALFNALWQAVLGALIVMLLVNPQPRADSA